MGCVFCDLISGKKKTQSGKFPFKILKETKNTISFLSIDFPAHENGHTLVIPKKHYVSIADIPPKIINEIMAHAKIILKAIRKNHEGCNILVNDGKFAEQTIFHTHFHIIPRDKGDMINIERWKSKKPTITEFKELYKNMKERISKTDNSS